MAEYRNVAIGLLEENKGQIEGLPANPRQWTRMDLDSLKKSIEETPELLEARGCIAVPHEGRFVVLGGNMSTSRAFTDGKKGQRTGSETSSTIRRSSRTPSMWTR